MHEIQQNGVAIVRTEEGLGVSADPSRHTRPLRVDVSLGGRLLKSDCVDPRGAPWRDAFAGVDLLAVGVRVYDGETLLAHLPTPGAEPLPFMVLQGEQRHVTESSVSVPPALTITDGRGDTWTLGFEAAPKGRSPDGEFAFEVLRNGVGVGEVASRIEMRGGRVRIFTAVGWKRLSLSGREFI